MLCAMRLGDMCAEVAAQHAQHCVAGELLMMATLPGLQGQGLGSKLLAVSDQQCSCGTE